MTEQLWRRCPKAAPSVVSPYHPAEWSCPCHGSLGERPLVPVAAGALLIEDGFDAAVERMLALRRQPHTEDDLWRREYADLLRAAAGERP